MLLKTNLLLAKFLVLVIKVLSKDTPCNLLQAPHGHDALSQLGDRIHQLSTDIGLPVSEIEGLFKKDPNLKFDNCTQHPTSSHHVFYVEQAPKQPPAKEQMSARGSVKPLATDVFKLHSRPIASKKLCIDFKGSNISGTAWNSNNVIVAPPFDCDGNPAVFGSSELTMIYNVWLEVAEHYKPFNIDVTTECTDSDSVRSSANDSTYGCRALVSPVSKLISPGSSGLAFVGVFGEIGAYHQPAWVFSDTLYCNPSWIADVVSHECGHTFGLHHDGTSCQTAQGPASAYYLGQGTDATSWAPIMGSAYYKSRATWNKGDYQCANNQEDDLAIIASKTQYVSDDYPSSCTTAKALPTSDTMVARGVISTTADVDAFSFQAAAGSLVSVSVAVATRSPDLDAELVVLSPSCSTLATYNPATTLSIAAQSFIVPANGTYYLFVLGVGSGDPLTTGYSDYASLGQYTLTVTVAPPARRALPGRVGTSTTGLHRDVSIASRSKGKGQTGGVPAS